MEETTVKAPEAETQETKTFTQEEVNSIVQERLFKERKKYEGFDEIKAKADKFDEMEEASKTELQRANDRVKTLETELNALKAENEVKAITPPQYHRLLEGEKVSQATSIPTNLLTGATEEECLAQAQAIRAFANPSYPEVKDAGEVVNIGKPTTRDQFNQWAAEAFS